MPFRSEAQRRFLFAKHPAVAKRWADKYGVPKRLPEKVKPSAAPSPVHRKPRKDRDNGET